MTVRPIYSKRDGTVIALVQDGGPETGVLLTGSSRHLNDHEVGKFESATSPVTVLHGVLHADHAKP